MHRVPSSGLRPIRSAVACGCRSRPSATPAAADDPDRLRRIGEVPDAVLDLADISMVLGRSEACARVRRGTCALGAHVLTISLF
jgi:hypothetical protein